MVLFTVSTVSGIPYPVLQETIDRLIKGQLMRARSSALEGSAFYAQSAAVCIHGRCCINDSGRMMPHRLSVWLCVHLLRLKCVEKIIEIDLTPEPSITFVSEGCKVWYEKLDI